MEIKFPYWVKITPCRYRTNSRIWKRGSRGGSIHGAVRVERRMRIR